MHAKQKSNPFPRAQAFSSQFKHHAGFLSLLHPEQTFSSVPALVPSRVGHAPQYKPQYPSNAYSVMEALRFDGFDFRIGAGTGLATAAGPVLVRQKQRYPAGHFFRGIRGGFVKNFKARTVQIQSRNGSSPVADAFIV